MVDLSAFLAATGQLGQANALIAARQEEKRRRKEAERAAMFRTVGTVAGAALGSMAGPPGMMMGATIGNMAGGAAGGQAPSALEVAQVGAQGYGMYQQGQQRNAEMAALKALDAQRTSDRSTMPGQQGIPPADYERIVALQAGQRSPNPLSTTANVLSIAQSLQPPPPPKGMIVPAGAAVVDPTTNEPVFTNKSGDKAPATTTLYGTDDVLGSYEQRAVFKNGEYVAIGGKKYTNKSPGNVIRTVVNPVTGQPEVTMFDKDGKKKEVLGVDPMAGKGGGTSERERMIGFVSDIIGKQQAGLPITNEELRIKNLYKQVLGRDTYMQTPNGWIPVKGVDFEGVEKQRGSQPPAAPGSGDIPLPVRPNIPKPLPSGEASKGAQLTVALKTFEDVKANLIKPDGSIDRGLVATMAGNIPGTEGRRMRQQLKDAMEAKLRAESGAAVPDTEVSRMAERYMPSPLDNDASIISKLQRMEDYLNGTIDLFTFGRGILSDKTIDAVEKYQGRNPQALGATSKYSSMTDDELLKVDISGLDANDIGKYNAEMDERGF